MARDIALVAARVPGTRVLLLDIDFPGHGQLVTLRRDFGLTVAETKTTPELPANVSIHLLTADGGSRQFTEQLSGPSQSALYVSEIRAPQSPGHLEWSALFPTLRMQFDIILIDSPSKERSHDGLLLAPEVDVNLLVVEAEQTNVAVVRSLRDHIQRAGGVIGGVILNKRSYNASTPTPDLAWS